jgi:DNA-binding NarL/FixJ family response regulator
MDIRMPKLDGLAATRRILAADDSAVAAGDAFLSPAVTKRVIEQFAQIPRRDAPKALDELTEREVFRLIAQASRTARSAGSCTSATRR